MSGKRRKNTIHAVEAGRSLPPEAEDFDAAKTLFLRRCLVRNLTTETMRYYREVLTDLESRMDKHGITGPASVSKTLLEDEILAMRDAGLSDATIRSRLRGWRAYFNFLRDEGIIADAPTDGVVIAKSGEKVIETFSKPQIKSLLDAPDRDTFTGYRDYVIMLTLLDTGMRVSELEGIQISNIDWSLRTIKVFGKGRKERVVPFQETLAKHLRQYVKIRGLLDHDTLFVNIDNRPMARRSIQERISSYGKMAQITNVRVSPHTFRHTFARMYIMNGGDVFSLQKILGHTTLDMVRKYVNLWGTDIAKKHAQYSPLERLNDDDFG